MLTQSQCLLRGGTELEMDSHTKTQIRKRHIQVLKGGESGDSMPKEQEVIDQVYIHTNIYILIYQDPRWKWFIFVPVKNLY